MIEIYPFGSTKLRSSSSYVEFDVWPGPKCCIALPVDASKHRVSLEINNFVSSKIKAALLLLLLVANQIES